MLRRPGELAWHYRACRYNNGNVNNKSNPGKRYARTQLNDVWTCYIRETGVSDPLTAANSIETTTFRIRVHASDSAHAQHERIRSKELFEKVLSAVRRYRGSEEGWTQWCKETGVCADC